MLYILFFRQSVKGLMSQHKTDVSHLESLLQCCISKTNCENNYEMVSDELTSDDKNYKYKYEIPHSFFNGWKPIGNILSCLMWIWLICPPLCMCVHVFVCVFVCVCLWGCGCVPTKKHTHTKDILYVLMSYTVFFWVILNLFHDSYNEYYSFLFIYIMK